MSEWKMRLYGRGRYGKKSYADMYLWYVDADGVLAALVAEVTERLPARPYKVYGRNSVAGRSGTVRV